MESRKKYLASEICRFFGGPKELFRLLALDISHLGKIEVANRWAAPYNPIAVVLRRVSILLEPCRASRTL
jgi:hypothetical protein